MTTTFASPCPCPDCACEMKSADDGICMFCASGMHASSSNRPALERFEALDLVATIIDNCGACGFPRPTYAVKMPGSNLFEPLCIVCKLKREALVNAPDCDEHAPCEYCHRTVDGSTHEYVYEDRAMRSVRMCPTEQDLLAPGTERQCDRCGDRATDIYFDVDAQFFAAGELKFICHTCIVIDHLRQQVHQHLEQEAAGD